MVDVVHVAKEILEEITDIPVEDQSIGTPVRSTQTFSRSAFPSARESMWTMGPFRES